MPNVPFTEPLREFEVSLADVEANFEFVRAAGWLRPRLGKLLNWDGIDAEGQKGAQRFMNAARIQPELFYRGMLIIIAGAFEQLIRRMLSDSVRAISALNRKYQDIDAQIVLQNVFRTGQALATVVDPPDHVDLNYGELCRNVGTCYEDSDRVTLNPDAFALLFSTLTPARLEDVLHRIGVKLNWDDIGRSADVRKALGETRNRDAANAAQRYFKAFIRNRNRAAHTGSGGQTIAENDVELALTFFRAFTSALAPIVTRRLAQMQ